MLKVSKQSKLASDEVIERASRFFGPGGEQLEETHRDACCISFQGGGGFVTVSVDDRGKKREVDVETREFDHQAERFLDEL